MKSLLAEDGFLSPLGVNYSCEGILQRSRGQTGRPSCCLLLALLFEDLYISPLTGSGGEEQVLLPGPEFLDNDTCSFLYCFFTFNQAPGKIRP